ncbi:MAG TPA: VOC family protein [Gemmatimonadaceae bacterium]|nr:VOC family protein [Gemmatimonadaceae bacterium]
MKPILPCLSFANGEQTEQAVRTYIDLFRAVFGQAGELARTTFSQAEIDTLQQLHGLPPEQLPGPAGAVKTIRFHLNGMELLALNGGGYFGRFHESFSLYINCDTQEQIDHLHEALSEGGQVQPCGWVKDRFGVSWQIVPDFVLGIDEGPDRAAAERMNAAILGMMKIDREYILKLDH